MDGGQNLAHGVLGDGVGLAAEGLLLDKGQAHGALAGVMGDGVSHQTHSGLPGDLLHDLGLADTGRAHQQHGALADGGDHVGSQLVLHEICLQCIENFLFCLFDVHIASPLLQLRHLRQIRFVVLPALAHSGLVEFILRQHQLDGPGRHLHRHGRLLQHHKGCLIGRPFFRIGSHAVGEIDESL